MVLSLQTGVISSDDHHDYKFLPSLIHRLFRDQQIDSFELGLTQGFWRPTLWGLHPKWSTPPTGASLLVHYDEGLSKEEVDTRWESLVHLLNGMFCTSLVDIVPKMTSFPKLFPSGSPGEENWRYGRLSGETMCSENLRPWKKMLPCKQSGLVSLLEPRHLLSSRFFSLSINCNRRQDGENVQWALELRADSVQFVDTKRSGGERL